jgi:serine/threonine-protein kinase
VVQTEGFQDALGAGYRLLERRGRGAAGEVWRAVDRRTDEIVAAKLLRSEHVSDRDLVGRFIRERSILTQLRHPNIVAVRDLVVEGERLAIVMDFVDGGSLRDVLHDVGPLEPALAVGVAAAVLDGLASAHDQGVLHRDIKPDNVLLTETWRLLRPGDLRLTDFGIARIVADGAGTTTGLLGTPEYMSPELLTTGECDLSTDVYGVGILLYELLAGRTPFAGPGTDYTVAHRHVSSEPPRLPVPDPLWEVLEQLLAKDPGARPSAARAAALLRGLHAGLSDLPALTVQGPPDDFASARGPATMVKGGMPLVDPARPGSTGGRAADGPDPDEADDALPVEIDLGPAGPQTTLRPMQRVAVTERRTTPEATRETTGSTPWWRDPRVLGVVAGAALLVIGAVLLATRDGGGKSPDGPSRSTAAAVTQQDQSLPTGLTISRKATYEPETGTVELTVTYAAQNAELGGPFLEIIPDADGGCAEVEWQGAPQEPNLPTTTGVSDDCGWSVEPGPVPAQGNVSVTARFPMSLGGGDSTSALQEWLDDASARTTAAVTDPDLSGTAYPVQRMQGIEVAAPQRTVSQKTLRLSLYPIWPSGTDTFNPLYRSPAIGDPSSLLTAVAGGEDGVRFSDGCSGALAVSPDGLVVTALTVAPECHVAAQVGNFPTLSSNTFAIVTRGG